MYFSQTETKEMKMIIHHNPWRSNNIYSNSSLTHLKSGQVNQISIITHPAGYTSILLVIHILPKSKTNLTPK